MLKWKFIFIALSVVWYVVCSLYICAKDSWLHFFGAFMMYAFGAYYVYCWVFRRSMMAPYIGRDVKYTGRVDPLRSLYLILGLC